MVDLPVMPDLEQLVLDALRFYLDPEDGPVYVDIPYDWNDEFPFTVIVKFMGDQLDPRYIDTGLISASTFAADRKTASRVARRVQAALVRAAREQFGNEEGFICRFVSTKSPVSMKDGLSGKHADAEMFDGTYTLTVRPRTFYDF